VMKEKWFWFFFWPLATGSLVGFGALGPGAHPWTGWWDAFAGGTAVLGAVGMGAVLGLGIRQKVMDGLTLWATSSDALYEQERVAHEKTADVLFELAYGVTSPAAAQAYLAELDEEEDEEESPEECH
jgi:hypothetical protein